MPDLSTDIHVNMLRGAQSRGDTAGALYGMHWGNPDEKPFLGFIRDRFCAPYVGPKVTALEIGPGGGRWTRYLLGCRKLYAVDFHQELLDELGQRFQVPHLHPIKNSGADFPGISAGEVDFVFSFGVFVHLDMPIIEAYLDNLKTVCKPGANIVIQYGDKNKVQAKRNAGFSDNDPRRMRRAIMDRGYVILEENLTVMPHAAVVRFTYEVEPFLGLHQTYTP